MTNLSVKELEEDVASGAGLGSDCTSMLNVDEEHEGTSNSDHFNRAATRKRQRTEDSRRRQPPEVVAGVDDMQRCMIFQLPAEVLELILSFLDSPTLALLGCCCKTFLSKDRASRLSLVNKVARDQLVRWQGPDRAARWRHHSWLDRLHIEETDTLFDRSRCEKQGFVFTTGGPQSKITSVRLEGIGPKLLVSDVTTADVPRLRWRLELKGNNAVEFGTIPVALQEQAKALHKCYNDNEGARPSGFCSAITVGSMLPVKLPLMRGSVVEIMATRDKLEYIVTNPPNGMEMTWHNTITIPKPYKGPLEFRFEQDLPPDQPVKLAVTCWARAAFEVLHTQPSPSVQLEALAQSPSTAEAGKAVQGAQGGPSPPVSDTNLCQLVRTPVAGQAPAHSV